MKVQIRIIKKKKLEELQSQARRRLAREGPQQTIGSGSSRISRRRKDIDEEDFSTN